MFKEILSPDPGKKISNRNIPNSNVIGDLRDDCSKCYHSIYRHTYKTKVVHAIVIQFYGQRIWKRCALEWSDFAGYQNTVEDAQDCQNRVRRVQSPKSMKRNHKGISSIMICGLHW